MRTLHPLLTNKALQPSVDWVPDNYGPFWKDCCTVVVHAPRAGHGRAPLWFTNQFYNSYTKETWWQFFVKHSGLNNAIAQREAFLTGFPGIRGTYWCGLCYWNKRLLDIGEKRDYPDLYSYYALPETRDTATYGAWLYLARFGGSTLVQGILRQVTGGLPFHTTVQVTRGVQNTSGGCLVAPKVACINEGGVTRCKLDVRAAKLSGLLGKNNKRAPSFHYTNASNTRGDLIEGGTL